MMLGTTNIKLNFLDSVSKNNQILKKSVQGAEFFLPDKQKDVKTDKNT